MTLSENRVPHGTPKKNNGLAYLFKVQNVGALIHVDPPFWDKPAMSR